MLKCLRLSSLCRRNTMPLPNIVYSRTASHYKKQRNIKRTLYQASVRRSTPYSIVDRGNVILTDDYLLWLNVSQLSAEEISEAVRELHKLAYKQLDHLPWLQTHNYQISFIQLTMNDKLDLLDPVLEHPHLQLLLDAVVNNCPEFSNKSLVDCLCNLLWLGLPTHSDTVVAVHTECSKRAHTFDLELITSMTDAMRALNRTDFKIMSKLVQRFVEILPDYGSGESHDGVTFANATLSCLQFCSTELTEQCTFKALELIKQPGSLDDPENIGRYLRLSRRLNGQFLLSSGSTDALQTLHEIISLSRQSAIDKSEQLKPVHIAEICSNLKLCRSYSKHCSISLQKQAMSLLEDPDIRVCDISNLLYAFNRDTSLHNKRRIESVLYHNIDNADVLVLTNVVDSIMDMRCKNRDIHVKVQEKIIEHCDNILKFVTRFRRVLRLLSHRNFHSPVLQAQFYNSMLSGLESQHGIRAWNISMISRYLLPSMQYFIPDNMFHKLQQIIPHSSLQDLLRIVGGINKIKQPWTSQLQNQVLHLQNLLHHTILQKLAEGNNFNTVHQAAKEMVINSHIRDPLVTDKIFGFFPNYTKCLTDISMQKVSSILQRLPYYMPEVCDDVMRHICDNHQLLDFEQLITALFMLSRVGHNAEPHLLEQFSKACLLMYQRDADQLDAKTVVALAQTMSQLQIYPEDLLQHVFRIDYLEHIDSFIEANPQNRLVVETLLMKLNRQVILDCPEMDIPWFHEQFCKDHVAGRHHGLSAFHQQIDGALVEILGDSVCYKTGSFTPYYYHLDFECILDGNHKPVKMLDVIGKELPREYKRVALLGLSEGQYCYNSKHVCGYEQMKRRHLELMGYTVVVVPHFEWFSMGLSDWTSKVDYLKKKLSS